MPVAFVPDEPQRPVLGTNPPGFPGGGGGGGVGGGGGGGGSSVGGVGGAGFGGLQGIGSIGSLSGPMANKRKRYYMQGSPGSVSTSPNGYAFGGPVAKPSDSVQASLTPGEFVVNRTAASDPNNAQMLEHMNQQGLEQGGYEDAYSAPDGSMQHEGMEAQSPGLSREALVELLTVLLSGQGDEGYGLGGWVGKHKGLLLGLGAAALPFALPAIGAALGGGGAAASTGAAAGASGVGSVAVPATAHTVNTGLLGTLTRTAQMHPGLMKAAVGAYGVKQDMDQRSAQERAQQEQMDLAANNDYLNARQRSEQGYAFGGPVWGRAGWTSPTWARGGMVGAAQPALGPAAAGDRPGGAWNQAYVGADPSVMNGMAEAGSRDANDYASGVFRQAQLEGADPGAQAAYRLRALAGASRGAADRLGAYRTDMAAKDLDYRRGIDSTNAQRNFEFEKQRRDAYNQERLKRMK